MIVAHFVGNHAKDTLAVRAGWSLTRLVQRGAIRGDKFDAGAKHHGPVF